MFLADAMGFLADPGQPPVIAEKPELDLIHLTAAPPWLTDAYEVAQTVEQFIRQVKVQNDDRWWGVLRKKHLDCQGLKIVLGLQNTPKDVSRKEMQKLFDLGIRIMQPWYKGENEYGGGFAWPAQRLTPRGTTLLELMAEVGMILDLSHAGHRSARDALRMVRMIRERGGKLSVCVTHTGCYSVFPHIRNAPDDVIRGVAELGGVVGIYGLTFGLHQEESGFVGAMLPHLNKALEVCGSKAVCIGSDVPYNSVSEEDRQRFDFMAGKLDADGLFNTRYPDYVTDLRGPRKMSHLRVGLDTLGCGGHEHFSNKAVEGICGLNFLNFLQRSLPD